MLGKAWWRKDTYVITAFSSGFSTQMSEGGRSENTDQSYTLGGNTLSAAVKMNCLYAHSTLVEVLCYASLVPRACMVLFLT